MLIDTNVYLSRWPSRRLPWDETAVLVANLSSRGVTQAWVASFDALLHRDVDAVNRRVSQEVREHGHGLLFPFGCVNCTLPDWQEDLRRCAEDYGIRGIRLHPDYHDYKLDAPAFLDLLDLAEHHELLVQIAAQMEDVRTQHPRLRVAPADLRPLAKTLGRRERPRVQILNGFRSSRDPVIADFADCPSVAIEIALLEGVGGLEELIRRFPFERVLFGSYAPFYQFESATLKLEESELGDTIRSAIATRNALRFASDLAR